MFLSSIIPSRMEKDGIHWKPDAHREMTMMLLTYMAGGWDHQMYDTIKLHPNYIEIPQRSYIERPPPYMEQPPLYIDNRPPSPLFDRRRSAPLLPPKVYLLLVFTFT